MGWSSWVTAFARDERVLLISIGLATFGVVSTMMATLTMIRDDSEIPPIEPKTEYITQETEDSLQLETLDKLVDHPNYSIRKVALRIVCDRGANDQHTIRYLLQGITREDYDIRLQCLRGLNTLMQYTTDAVVKLHTPTAYSAIVRSLELSLHDSSRLSLRETHWDNYYLRDTAEKLCLQFLKELTFKHDANPLVKACFVEKWLCKQDWGNTPEEIQENFKSYMETKENQMSNIIIRVRTTRRGLKALVKCGLIHKALSRGNMRELTDVIMEDDFSDIPLQRQSRRTREHSAEERRLRRQHREAMVLNDGSRPLAREDIIERDHDSPT